MYVNYIILPCCGCHPNHGQITVSRRRVSLPSDGQYAYDQIWIVPGTVPLDE